MLVALNMMDMAAERRLEIDVQGLAQRLGCPVVPLTASKNQGIDELKAAIRDAAGKTDLPIAETIYPPLVQEAREQLAKELHDVCAVNRIDPSWLALKLLEGDEQPAKYIVLGETIATRIATLRAAVEQQEDEEIDIVIASARYGFISWLTQDLVKKGANSTPPFPTGSTGSCSAGFSASPFFWGPCT